jgi:hypothetical protein
MGRVGQARGVHHAGAERDSCQGEVVVHDAGAEWLDCQVGMYNMLELNTTVVKVRTTCNGTLDTCHLCLECSDACILHVCLTRLQAVLQGRPGKEQRDSESGQLLIDRERHADVVQYLWWMNSFAPELYKHLHGMYSILSCSTSVSAHGKIRPRFSSCTCRSCQCHASVQASFTCRIKTCL